MARTDNSGQLPPAESLADWSIPALLQHRATTSPDQAAFRYKKLGVFEEVTWAMLRQQATRAATGLARLGVKPRDRVGIMTGAHPLAIVAEHAVWMVGAVSVGIFPSASLAEVDYVIGDAGVQVAIVQGQSQLKILAGSPDLLNKLDVILVLDQHARDPTGFPSTCRLLDFSEWLQSSRRPTEGAAPIDPGALGCITYTSGTTGPPKGVMHSHRTMLYGADCKRIMVPELTQREQRTVLAVPFTHLSPKTSAILLPLISRLIPHIPGSPQTVRTAILESKPTYIVQPPRFYEKLSQELVAAAQAARGLRRRIFQLASRIGMRMTHIRWQGRPAPAWLKAAYALARFTVFRPMLRQIGYDRLVHAYVGSAPCHPKLVELWQSWGVDLRESYGLTESGGNITAQQTAFPKPGNVGAVLDRADHAIRCTEDGELLYRGPGNFLGYWNKPAATAKALVDGWLQTGDLVQVSPNGLISLVGRKSQVIVTTGGKSLNPETIESALKSSSFIAEAMAAGHGRRFVVALIEPDLDALAEWSARNGFGLPSYRDAKAHPDVQTLIAAEVEKANARLGRTESVRRFAITSVPFSTISGAYTPMMKMRREAVERHFAETIENLYEPNPHDAMPTEGRPT
jgi:long-chain acyl-CoA synthetase